MSQILTLAHGRNVIERCDNRRDASAKAGCGAPLIFGLIHLIEEAAEVLKQ